MTEPGFGYGTGTGAKFSSSRVLVYICETMNCDKCLTGQHVVVVGDWVLACDCEEYGW